MKMAFAGLTPGSCEVVHTLQVPAACAWGSKDCRSRRATTLVAQCSIPCFMPLPFSKFSRSKL